MWECEYAQEPFDLKLFVYRLVSSLRWIFAAACLGTVLIGGGYYLKNVTFGGQIPYVITDKYYVEFAQDPKDWTQTYTYITGYAWNDWLKSDEVIAPLLERLTLPLTKEEFVACYEASLPADLRIPYVTVTHVNPEWTEEISGLLQEAMTTFSLNMKEIEEIRLIDTAGPALQVRDIRTFRACVLGAVAGTFFALFWIGFRMLIDGAVWLPEQFSHRYGIPAAGYVDRSGKVSDDMRAHVEFLFADCASVGLTAVDPELDLMSVETLLPKTPDREYVCIPSVLQVPESGKLLRERDGVILLVEAGVPAGKAIEAVLHFCGVQDIKITGVILTNVDPHLVHFYRFVFWKRKEKV